jgi:hypothetical protein
LLSQSPGGRTKGSDHDTRRNLRPIQRPLWVYPFFVYWRGSDEELQALCQKAIDRGSELIDDEIAEAKGEELPPNGALD